MENALHAGALAPLDFHTPDWQNGQRIMQIAKTLTSVSCPHCPVSHDAYHPQSPTGFEYDSRAAAPEIQCAPPPNIFMSLGHPTLPSAQGLPPPGLKKYEERCCVLVCLPHTPDWQDDQSSSQQ